MQREVCVNSPGTVYATDWDLISAWTRQIVRFIEIPNAEQSPGFILE